MTEPVRAIADRLLVELEPVETETSGGIVIPDAVAWSQDNRGDLRWGRALSVGGRVQGIREGDRVLISGWLNDSLNGYGYGGRGERDLRVMVAEEQVFAVDEGAA